VITVGDRPSDWGTTPRQRPHSRIQGPTIPATTWIDSPAASFRDSLLLHAGSADLDARFTWRVGDRRGEGRNFMVRESGRVILAAVDSDGRSGPDVHAEFWRIPNSWTVEVESVPNPQYTAGGPDALVDGRRGPKEWRTGAWQGYQGQDFVATVDLGAVHRVKSVGAGFLQDQGSWILLPTELIFEASEDGTVFAELGRATHEIDDRWQHVLIEDIGIEFEPIQARYLRIRAVNYGTLPSWHQGAGGEAFIFVDEISVMAETVEEAPQR
jgi:hypothetical protein